MEQMKSDSWFACYPADLINNTAHLSPHDFGAYWRLMCWYYQNGPLPDSDEDLQNITGVKDADWMRCRGRFITFFTRNGDGKLHQKRADIEIALREEMNEKRRRQTAAATAARHVTENVTTNVTDNATSVQPQPQPQPQLQPQPQPKNLVHIHTPVPKAETATQPPEQGVSMYEQKQKFETNNRFEWLKGKLCTLYGRPRVMLSVGEEEYAVLEVARRGDVKGEFELLTKYRREVGGKYFPQTIARLCRDWDATLDKARNHADEPRNHATMSLAERELRRIRV